MDEVEVRIGGRRFGKAAELQRRVDAFAEAMRAEGIHVGVGAPGAARCVVCDEPWPCATSTQEVTK